MRFTVNSKDNTLNQINQLLEKDPHQVSSTDVAEVSFAVINMFEDIYGARSTQIGMVESVQKRIYDSEEADFYKRQLIVEHLHGFLRTLKSDIKEGRVNIQSQFRGEILGDFLSLAHETLNAGQKDVAAVLACAALEDVQLWRMC